MNRIRKAIACMLFLQALSLTACGTEGKADASVTEESSIFAENESVTENIEKSDPAAEDENAEQGGDNVNPAAAGESLSEKRETETIADLSTQDSSGENTYKSILLGNGNFICMDPGYRNKSLNIREIGQIITDDDSVNISAEKFAVIDLDGDGEKEAVLWIRINGMNDYGFEILHAVDGEIYGHTLAYREFMNLKADGTFMMSRGASDTGIGKITFSGTEFSITEKIRCHSKADDADGERIIQQFINGELCSADEVEGVLSSQGQKADVKWYDLSEDNINALF